MGPKPGAHLGQPQLRLISSYPYLIAMAVACEGAAWGGPGQRPG
jgi:hypothetical protein